MVIAIRAKWDTRAKWGIAMFPGHAYRVGTVLVAVAWLASVQAQDFPIEAMRGAWTGVVRSISPRGPINTWVLAGLSFDQAGPPGSRIGSFHYPELDCSGALILESQESDGSIHVSLKPIASECSASYVYQVKVNELEVPLMESSGEPVPVGPIIELAFTNENGWNYHGVLFRFEGHLDAMDPAAVVAREQARLAGEAWQEIGMSWTGAEPEQWPGALWMADPETACKVLMFTDDYKFLELSSIKWTGDCVDGKAAGPGQVEIFDSNGYWLWTDEYKVSNGQTMVDGVPTGMFDDSLISLELTSCDFSSLFDIYYVDVKAVVDASLDLQYTAVLNEISRRAFVFAYGRCKYTMNANFIDIRVAYGKPVPAGRDSRSVSAPYNVPDRMPEVVDNYQRDKYRSQLEELSIAARRERDRREAAERLEASRVSDVLQERDVLARNYSDVAVRLHPFGESYTAYSVAVTVPAQFPHPQFEALGIVPCDSKELTYTSADAQAAFETFLELEGASINDGTFQYGDIEVACDSNGHVIVSTSNFYRTLALLDAFSQGRQFGLPEFVGSPARDTRFLSFAFGVYEGLFTSEARWLSLANPSQWDTSRFAQVRLWENGVVGASTGFAVVGIDTGNGAGLQAVVFQGSETPRPYDLESGPLHIVVRWDEDQPEWDHLIVQPQSSKVTWWQTTDAP